MAAPTSLPPGMTYEDAFLTPAEEQALIHDVESLAFGHVEMHGVVARRRVSHFGVGYEYNSRNLREALPLPGFLDALGRKVEAHLGLDDGELREVLVTEYRPDAGIGWHRDAPAFGLVAGVSLLSACRFKMRPMPGAPGEPFELRVEPRSLYSFAGHARWRWQHSIPAAKELRYSITFRTLRADRKPVET
jgi:alkylated DNA repair dioxygenase AlkB